MLEDHVVIQLAKIWVNASLKKIQFLCLELQQSSNFYQVIADIQLANS